MAILFTYIVEHPFMAVIFSLIWAPALGAFGYGVGARK